MAAGLSQIVDLLSRASPPTEAPASRGALTIKRHVPFGDSINQNNIVELFDDWLYNVPKFFSFRGGLDDTALRDFCEGLEYGFGATVGQAIMTVRRSQPRRGEYYGHEEAVKAIIVDVPETSDSVDPKEGNPEEDTQAVAGPSGLDCSVVSTRDLCARLDTDRTCAKAKKRILQFFRAKRTTALICYLASSKEEDLVGFFDRHTSYEKYVFDEVTSGLENKWVTELHLSFYLVLSKGGDEKDDEIPRADQILFLNSGKSRRGEDRWVRRAVMSFRFDGDFFDRFWTCHFLEHDPCHTNDELPSLDIRQSVGDHWKQRRVLELVMFDRVLERMIDATDAILQEARARVLQSLDSGGHERDGVGPNVPTTGQGTSALADALNLIGANNNDAFLSASTLCHKVQHLLQAVEDDLGKNLETIWTWSDREKERGVDRPRWTRKDEERYQGTISNWQASNKHRILELTRCRANIASYKLSLARKLEDNIRNELDLRGADDIRLFTYVTAVFLPIGFATGVFSMSETPSGITLGSMIGTAVTALLLTLIALVNAKFLRKQAVTPTIYACGAAFRAAYNAIFNIASKQEDSTTAPEEYLSSPSASSDRETNSEGKQSRDLLKLIRRQKEPPPNSSEA